MLIFDLETDGLLDTVSAVHCVHMLDTEDLEAGVLRYNDHGYKAVGTVAEGIRRLGDSEECLAHNGIGYDYLVLDKLFSGWDSGTKRRDSIVMTRVIWTELKAADFSCRDKGYWKLLGSENPCPEKMGGIIGSHSLKAWGYRLGENKDDYDPRTECPVGPEGRYNDWGCFTMSVGDAWKTVGWTESMDDYCVQDVVVTAKLWQLIEAKQYDQRCLDLEHQFATIIDRQVRFGFQVNVKKAKELEHRLLIRKEELGEELREVFDPWYALDGKRLVFQLPKMEKPLKGKMLTNFENYCERYQQVMDAMEAMGERMPTNVPRTNNKANNTVAGAPFNKLKHITFNPASVDHIGQRLQAVYGWEPEEFGKDGKPTCDNDILSTLDYPAVPAIMEYLVISKRLGMLSDGKQAILRKVSSDGRMHGKVNTNGAGTGRCTHSSPNVAQTPAVGAAYGAEFRELYEVPRGYKLVGADASGLELRTLSHYMAAYDDGAYAKEVVEGDAHWVNLRAIGVADCERDTSDSNHKAARDDGKTWIYAFLYGCAELMSGVNFHKAYTSFHGVPPKGTLRGNGRASRAAIKRNLPALAELEKAVKGKAKAAGHVRGLDGRRINVRSQHSALNALLQGAGAIVMKKALCILDEDLQASGLVPGMHYEFVANVHDEWQVQVVDDDRMLPDLVAALSCDAMTKAGEALGMRCRIDGEADIGNNWKETH